MVSDLRTAQVASKSTPREEIWKSSRKLHVRMIFGLSVSATAANVAMKCHQSRKIKAGFVSKQMKPIFKCHSHLLKLQNLQRKVDTQAAGRASLNLETYSF